MPHKKQAHKSSGTPATVALDAAGIGYTPHPYHHDDDSTNFGEEAAQALGIEAARVFKTLLADLGGELVVAVVPVANRLNLKALASAAGAKRAAMAQPHEAERATGMVVGGISPVGQRSRHRTFIDQSARAYETIHVSGGKRGLQIELAPDDLLRVTAAAYAPIAR